MQQVLNAIENNLRRAEEKIASQDFEIKRLTKANEIFEEGLKNKAIELDNTRKELNELSVKYKTLETKFNLTKNENMELRLRNAANTIVPEGYKEIKLVDFLSKKDDDILETFFYDQGYMILEKSILVYRKSTFNFVIFQAGLGLDDQPYSYSFSTLSDLRYELGKIWKESESEVKNEKDKVLTCIQ